MLKQDIIKKNWVEKTQLNLENGNSKRYKVEVIWDNIINIRESKSYLPDFYNMILWKSNFKEKRYLKTIIDNVIFLAND